jgi:hypothetical protein
MAQDAYFAVTQTESLGQLEAAERLLVLQLESIQQVGGVPGLSDLTRQAGSAYLADIKDRL